MTNQKTKKHFNLKKLLLIMLVVFAALFVSAISFVLIVTADANLDLSHLAGSHTNLVIKSRNGKELENSMTSKTASEINEQTQNAFVAVEDKRFFSHNGIDTKRIVGAMWANIVSGKKKQGASTITQQLVKNTHLSSEKTFSRKLKEMKIALQLERCMTKQDILKTYLDNIYFGNGCTGIENASKFYFGKSADKLSTGESALLAGLVKAPSATEPIKNREKALARKDLVLSLEHQQGYLTNEEYEAAKSEEINFVFGNVTKNLNEQYITAAKQEACKILEISIDELENSSYEIETYLDDKSQKILSDNCATARTNEQSSIGGIIVESKTGGVKAFCGNGTFDFINKRQPASTIKPILVYAPAIEENLVTPESFVLDAKTDFGGWSPGNAGGIYSGWISVRSALAHSKNIPAIKLLDAIGVEKAKTYAKRCGIKFDDSDTSLSLALGAMANGTSIVDLAGAYTVFPTGIAKEPAFVKSIKNGAGMQIYAHKPKEIKVFEPSTAYLVTDIMQDVAKTGTAKKLSSLNFEVAAKTGTNGDTSGNTDCYSVAVSSEDVLVCLLTTAGTDKKLASSINGSTIPTSFNKNVLERLYQSHKPKDFDRPQSVVALDLDTRALDKNQLKLAKQDTPYALRKTALFCLSNCPSDYYEEPKPVQSQEIPDKTWISVAQDKPLTDVTKITKNVEVQKLLEDILSEL